MHYVKLTPLIMSAIMGSIRPETVQVNRINETANTVTWIDCKGNLWDTTDADGIEYGDVFVFLFDTKGTVDITDDEIVDKWYEFTTNENIFKGGNTNYEN